MTYTYCSKGNKTPMSEVDNLRRILENGKFNYKFYTGGGQYDNTDCVNANFLIVLPLTNILKEGENPATLQCTLEPTKTVLVKSAELANGKDIKSNVFPFSVGRGGLSEIVDFCNTKGTGLDLGRTALFYGGNFYIIKDYATYIKSDWAAGYGCLICTERMTPEEFIAKYGPQLN